jgi:oxygen-dependent protoporphyrinogen oxidase
VLGFNKWEGMKLDGFGGLIPFLENRNLLGVLFMSSLFKNRAPENGALLSLFLGGVRKQEIMKFSEDEVKNVVEKECLELLSLKQFNPDLFKVIWHEKAIPQYGVESGLRFDTVKELEATHKGLFIGGNLRGGIGMADRMKQGKELAIGIV